MKASRSTPDDRRYLTAIKNGAIWGTGGLAVGLGGSLLSNRYWSKFRPLTLPQKVFGVGSIATLAFLMGTDKSFRDFEQKALDLEELVWSDEKQVNHFDDLKQHRLGSMSDKDKILESFKKNKYNIVLGSWATSMVGSFAFIATQPMPFSQKLIQARMYAQGLTVAVILATATLASLSSNSNEDATLDKAMYKFKAGSPHEIHQQQLREAKRNE
ncbi:hypothetical protein O181_055319 [Austropuccinia psidii MF-1]|uniref:HIG1 domain-containing protein n=1 Tax=Austropuccinia psidii MF-1 TaxID=1389203 RepID=A0A9Q3HUH7_9BASI|nr:hypothetical protein [Austropuccinia psidii MF-1]